MKKALFLGIIVALSGLNSCRTPELSLSPSLVESAPGMDVKGRNGFQIRQIIRYGDFKTDRVRRGWTSSFNVPFTVRFQGAREKLSFTQFGTAGLSAKVACVSRFRSVELPLLDAHFGISLSLKNYFAGTIVVNNGENWDFIVHNPNGDFLREEASAGIIKNSSTFIAIRAIRGLKGQPEWLKKLTVYGHEFVKDGQVVAAVSTLNRGKVWINPNLDNATQTVIAAVATGLLLRRDVEEAAVQ